MLIIDVYAYPCTGTPRRSKEEDEDGDEGNLGVDSGDVVGNGVAGSAKVSVVETNSDTNDGDQELADQHSKGAPDEKRPASKPLNGIERDRSRADVDEREDKGDQEGVADSTRRLEEGSRVVEDEVNTSPLLHHLKRRAEDSLA